MQTADPPLTGYPKVRHAEFAKFNCSKTPLENRLIASLSDSFFSAAWTSRNNCSADCLNSRSTSKSRKSLTFSNSTGCGTTNMPVLIHPVSPSSSTTPRPFFKSTSRKIPARLTSGSPDLSTGATTRFSSTFFQSLSAQTSTAAFKGIGSERSIHVCTCCDNSSCRAFNQAAIALSCSPSSESLTFFGTEARTLPLALRHASLPFLIERE